MEDITTQKLEKDFRIEIHKNSKGYTYDIRAYGETLETVKTNIKNLSDYAESLCNELQIREELERK